MRFAQADDSDGYLILAYGPEGVRIGARLYRRGLVLTPSRLLDDWGPACAQELAPDHFAPILELAPELIVLGTGRTQVFPDPAILAAVMERGIALESMDTGAACRTYNILMSEGRRVAAALLPW